MEEEPGCTVEKRISFKRSEDCIEEDADNPQTRGFIFGGSRNKKACTFTESCIEVVDINEGRIKKSLDIKQYFNDGTFKIECVSPLDIGSQTQQTPLSNDGFMFPLLLVGCSYSTGGMVLILPPYVDTVIRVIKIPNKVTSICPISSENITPGSNISLPSSLQLLSGLMAVGTQCGMVYLVELQRDTFLSSYRSPEAQDPLDLLVKPFSDLDTRDKVEAAMMDDSVHIALLLNSISVHNKMFFIQLPNNKICTKPFRQADVYISQLHVIEEANILVVAYLLRKHCEIEGEVYVYKNVMQLWDLAKLELLFTSGLWDACEITHLSHQVASDDPYASLYLHVACRTIDEDYPAPFTLLYELKFDDKSVDAACGLLKFSQFLECRKKFEWYMSSSELPYGRLLSLSSLQSGSDDMKLALYFTSLFSTATQSYRSLLYVFDLNQWYSAQMPEEYCDHYGPRYTTHYDLTEVLDARATPLSIDAYRSYEKVFTDKNHRIQFDTYYFPNAISFHSKCLLEGEVVSLAHQGIHERALNLMTDSRANCLLQPERYFALALRIHLQPIFMEPLSSYHQIEHYSQEEQRKFLLSLLCDLLDDISFSSFLMSSAREWALGAVDSVGCSVSFLVAWAWGHVSRGKQYVDSLAISLFDFADPCGFDARDTCLLTRFTAQLSTVQRLYRALAADNHLLAASAGLEQRMRTLATLSGYYKAVAAMLDAGLLPETHGLAAWTRGRGVPYPAPVIREYADQRRSELSSLASHSLISLPPQGLYMIDSLAVHLTRASAPLLAEQWGAAPPAPNVGPPLYPPPSAPPQPNVGPLYPPPSLQALLRVYLLEEVPEHVKDMILFYVKLDIQHFLPVPKNKEEESKLNYLTVNEYLDEEYRHMVRGVWCLDHNRWGEAYDHLKKAAKYTRVPTWLHYSTILLLLMRREHQLAYQYTCDFSPETSTEEHVKIQLTTFLNMGRLQKAHDFLRGSAHHPRLLGFLLDAARALNRLAELCALRRLSVAEEQALRSYLEKQRSRYADYLWLNFLYSRSRYCEAYEYKESIKRRHASQLYARVPSVTEPPDIERFIWRTEKQVDYMYNRCVPQLVKEEYQKEKRTKVSQPETDSLSTPSRKRLASDSSTQPLEQSSKRGKYEFEFSFAPVAHYSVSAAGLGLEGPGDDTALGALVTRPLCAAPDPNISALLSTPYVHKKGERPPPTSPSEIESAAPGSTHKPNKSLLKTPGSSSSVKKALSFASLEITPDDDSPTNSKVYSKALNFGSPTEKNKSTGKANHSKVLNFAEDEEAEGATLSRLQHLPDPADASEGEGGADISEDEEPMDCEEEDDANSLISEDLAYYEMVGRAPIRSELSVITEVSSESSFQSADDSGDGFSTSGKTGSTRNSITTAEIEPLSTSLASNSSAKYSVTRGDQSKISDVANISRTSDVANISRASTVTNFSTASDVTNFSTASEITSASEASYVSTMSGIRPVNRVTYATDEESNASQPQEDEGEAFGGMDERKSLKEESFKKHESEEAVDEFVERESTKDETVREDKTLEGDHSSSAVKASRETTPRKGRSDAARTLLEEELSTSPRRVSPRQHASSKVIFLATPTRSTRKSRALPSETEEITPRRVTRSRKGSVSSVESAETTASGTTGRTRRSSVSQESDEVVTEQEPSGVTGTPSNRSQKPSLSQVEDLDKPEQDDTSEPSTVKSTPLRRSRRRSFSQELEQSTVKDTTLRRSRRTSVSQEPEPPVELKQPDEMETIDETKEVSNPEPTFEDTTFRRSRRISVSQESDKSDEQESSSVKDTPSRRSRRSSVSQDPEQPEDNVTLTSIKRQNLRSASLTSLSSLESEPSKATESLTPHKTSMRKSVSNVDVSSPRTTRQSSRPLTSTEDSQRTPSGRRNLRSSSVSSQSSVDSVDVSRTPGRKMTSRRSTSKLQPISEVEVSESNTAPTSQDNEEVTYSVCEENLASLEESDEKNQRDDLVTSSVPENEQVESNINKNKELEETGQVSEKTVEKDLEQDAPSVESTEPTVESHQSEVYVENKQCDLSVIDEANYMADSNVAFETTLKQSEMLKSERTTQEFVEDEPMEVCENIVGPPFEETKPVIDTNQLQSILNSVNMADIVKIANAQKEIVKSDESTPPPTPKATVDMSSFFMPTSGFLFGTATSPPVVANPSSSGEQMTMSPTWNFSRQINKTESPSQISENVITKQDMTLQQNLTSQPETTMTEEIEAPTQLNMSEQVNVSLPLFKIGAVRSISNESYIRIENDAVKSATSEELYLQTENLTFLHGKHELSLQDENEQYLPNENEPKETHVDTKSLHAELKSEHNESVMLLEKSAVKGKKLDDTIELDTSNTNDQKNESTAVLNSPEDVLLEEENKEGDRKKPFEKEEEGDSGEDEYHDEQSQSSYSSHSRSSPAHPSNIKKDKKEDTNQNDSDSDIVIIDSEEETGPSPKKYATLTQPKQEAYHSNTESDGDSEDDYSDEEEDSITTSYSEGEEEEDENGDGTEDNGRHTQDDGQNEEFEDDDYDDDAFDEGEEERDESFEEQGADREVEAEDSEVEEEESEIEVVSDDETDHQVPDLMRGDKRNSSVEPSFVSDNEANLSELPVNYSRLEGYEPPDVQERDPLSVTQLVANSTATSDVAETSLLTSAVEEKAIHLPKNTTINSTLVTSDATVQLDSFVEDVSERSTKTDRTSDVNKTALPSIVEEETSIPTKNINADSTISFQPIESNVAKTSKVLVTEKTPIINASLETSTGTSASTFPVTSTRKDANLANISLKTMENISILDKSVLKTTVHERNFELSDRNSILSEAGSILEEKKEQPGLNEEDEEMEVVPNDTSKISSTHKTLSSETYFQTSKVFNIEDNIISSSRKSTVQEILPEQNEEDDVMEVIPNEISKTYSTLETNIASDVTLKNISLSYSGDKNIPRSVSETSIQNESTSPIHGSDKADLSIQFSDPLNFSSIEAINILTKLGETVASNDEPIESDFFSLQSNSAPKEDEKNTFSIGEQPTFNSLSTEVKNEDQSGKGFSLRSVRIEPRINSADANKEGVPTVTENLTVNLQEPKSSLTLDKSDAQISVKSIEQTKGVKLSEEKTLTKLDKTNLLNTEKILNEAQSVSEVSDDSKSTSIQNETQGQASFSSSEHARSVHVSKDKTPHNLKEKNCDRCETSPLNQSQRSSTSIKHANQSEETSLHKLEKSMLNIVENTKELKETRDNAEVRPSPKKPTIRSPRKSLLMRKTFEQSVFLPDSDSEFDETHYSKLRTDDDFTMDSIDQSLVTGESSGVLNSPSDLKKPLISHTYKDQTIFLPYSDSEEEVDHPTPDVKETIKTTLPLTEAPSGKQNQSNTSLKQSHGLSDKANADFVVQENTFPVQTVHQTSPQVAASSKPVLSLTETPTACLSEVIFTKSHRSPHKVAATLEELKNVSVHQTSVHIDKSLEPVSSSTETSSCKEIVSEVSFKQSNVSPHVKADTFEAQSNRTIMKSGIFDNIDDTLEINADFAEKSRRELNKSKNRTIIDEKHETITSTISSPAESKSKLSTTSHTLFDNIDETLLINAEKSRKELNESNNKATVDESHQTISSTIFSPAESKLSTTSDTLFDNIDDTVFINAEFAESKRQRKSNVSKKRELVKDRRYSSVSSESGPIDMQPNENKDVPSDEMMEIDEDDSNEGALVINENSRDSGSQSNEDVQSSARSKHIEQGVSETIANKTSYKEDAKLATKEEHASNEPMEESTVTKISVKESSESVKQHFDTSNNETHDSDTVSNKTSDVKDNLSHLAGEKSVSSQKVTTESQEKSPNEDFVEVTTSHENKDNTTTTKIEAPSTENQERTPQKSFVEVEKNSQEKKDKTPLNSEEIANLENKKTPQKISPKISESRNIAPNKDEGKGVLQKSEPTTSKNKTSEETKTREPIDSFTSAKRTTRSDVTPVKTTTSNEVTPAKAATSTKVSPSKPTTSSEITPAKPITRSEVTPAKPITRSEVTPAKPITRSDVTPAKAKVVEVSTPVSLRRSTRKVSTPGDPATPTTQRSLRRRTPSMSSETSTGQEEGPKRYSLRNRTPSISSETSMVEEQQDGGGTPVRRRSTRARTPSFDLESETNRTPVKPQTSRGSKSEPRKPATKVGTPKATRTRAASALVLDAGEDEASGSDEDDKRSWLHERTHLSEFNLDSEEEDKEEIDFDDVDETKMLVPEFFENELAKKSNAEVDSEEKTRKSKRKSKIFHSKDKQAAGTPTKRMRLRPSALAKIPEEKDAEHDREAKRETSGDSKQSAATSANKEEQESHKKELKQQTKEKSPQGKSKGKEASSKNDEKEDKESAKTIKKASTSKANKTTRASKLQPVEEANKEKEEENLKPTVVRDTGEDQKPAVERDTGEDQKPTVVRDTGEAQKPVLSRRASRALVAARLSAMDSTAGSTLNSTAGKAASSLYKEILLHAASVGAASDARLSKMRSSRGAKVRSSRAAEPTEPEEEEQQETDKVSEVPASSRRGKVSSGEQSRTPGPQIERSWPLRSRGGSVAKEEEPKSTKRGRDASDSPIPATVNEITKKRKITRKSTRSSVSNAIHEEDSSEEVGEKSSKGTSAASRKTARK